MKRPDLLLLYVALLLSFLVSTTISFAQITTNSKWTWMKGDSTINQVGVYGKQEIATPANKPGARSGSVSWTDNNGNLWLFGGYGESVSGNGMLNDLWKYNISTNLWTWVKGDSINDQYGIYGIQGLASPLNKPAAREGSVSWTDADGSLWILGGYGLSNDDDGYLNDLWKYNIITNQWTWMKGDTMVERNGVYGTQGFASPANKPGAREGSISWTDGHGKLWLFGGEGYATNEHDGALNDLWMYDPLTNQWTWVNGDKITDQVTVYGTKGITDPSSKPGGRSGSFSWQDAAGIFWLFGGHGYGKVSRGGLNDVWKYSPFTNQWTWLKGDSTIWEEGIYGTRGIPASANKPTARRFPGASWTDEGGNFWLFGGSDYLTNDLWKYIPSTNIWTWVKGDSTDNPGIYGTQGISTAANKPGGRDGCVAWKDGSGNFWLFGGDGDDASGGTGALNDLWKLTSGTEVCPVTSTTLTSDIIGNNYQWQVNTGSGFNNIPDNGNYSGTITINLQLLNIPSSWYGYQYRCVVDGNYSNVFTLQFISYWTGSSNTAWENPANWSCGVVPDANTDVIINSGLVVLSSNASCRSLNVNPEVIFTVSTGYNFTITH